MRLRRPIRTVVASSLVLGLTALAPAGATAAPRPPGPTPRPVGAPGIGDPDYPTYGNGGYDVRHYDIRAGYEPKTGRLTGRTTITATATQTLRRFNLDFALDAASVTVNGRPARFHRDGESELVVHPGRIRRGSTMRVTVTYAGVPGTTRVGGKTPWITTADGAVAIGEPEIAAWWFPSNDHPRDKATYRVSLTVPKGLEAVSNGTLFGTRSGRRTDTWTWRTTSPMATYMAFMAVGDFEITRGTSGAGVPWLNAVANDASEEARRAAANLARTPEVTDWFVDRFGPYPFEAIGAVAPATTAPFALENQTRPVYSRALWARGDNTAVIAHEVAHQWYGNSVTPENWRDIWLGEGFATWSEWYWAEGQGGPSADEAFRRWYTAYPADAAEVWDVVLSNPGPGKEFSPGMYLRGAMTLQALRNRVGEETFLAIMRGWAQEHRHGNASVADFVAYASTRSGEDLGPFFAAWLSTPGKPTPSAELGFPAAMLGS